MFATMKFIVCTHFVMCVRRELFLPWFWLRGQLQCCTALVLMLPGIIYDNITFESFLDHGLKKLSLNDIALFVAELQCLKVSAMSQA